MSELPEIDDLTFKLATGDEPVFFGDETSPPPVGGAPLGALPAGLAPSIGRRTIARPTWFDKRTAGKLRARKVRRLVRHVEPWSVLKVSLIFYFCLWVILLIAGVMLWSLAVSSGTIDNVEKFTKELFALGVFAFDADLMFRASAIGGLVLVVAGAGFTVLMAVLFNLISDVTGGVRFTVVEEETARPRPKRIRPRRSMLERLNAASGAASTRVPIPVAGSDMWELPEELPEEPPMAAESGPEESEPGAMSDEASLRGTPESTSAEDQGYADDDEVATADDPR